MVPKSGEASLPGEPVRSHGPPRPLHNIAIANIVRCVAYASGVVEVRILRNSRAIALHDCEQCKRGEGNTRIIDSRIKASKCKDIL